MKVLAFLCSMLCAWLLASAAAAGPAIELTPRGPVELVASGANRTGTFFIENTGDAPLNVSRVAVRTDADDPRVPRKVTVETESKTPVTLAPHAKSKVTVTWAPDPTPRQRQLYGHVVVTSTDEARGEVAMGIHAQMPTAFAPVTDHALSALILLPIAGALVAVFMHFSGRGRHWARHVTLGVTGLQAAVAVWVWHAFDGSIVRGDGNDGLQMIEHAPCGKVLGLGGEYFVGVDGSNVGPIVAAALVGFACALSTPTPARSGPAFEALLLFMSAGGIGALAAQDAVLWLACTGLLTAALVRAVSGFAEGPRRWLRLEAPLLLGFVALCFSVALLHGASDPTLLVGGERVQTSFSFPDLARVSFVAKTHPVVKAAMVLWLLGALAYAGAFPLHFWLPEALRTAPAAVGAMAVVTVSSVGLQAFVRIAAVLPEGFRWAAPTVLLLGLVGGLFAALAALACRDLSRCLGFAMVAQTGMLVAGLGSLTQQGLEGFMVGVPARAAAAGLVVLASGALTFRLGTRDTARLGGLRIDAPQLASCFFVGVVAMMAAPGTVTSWGVWMAAFGTLPRGVGAAAGVALAFGVLAVALTLVIKRVVLGELPKESKESAILEPFGGRVPDLDGKSFLALAFLSALVIVLGARPAPLFSVTSGTVHDVSASLNPPGPGEISDAR
jgi:NADH-quinone oxidoreductase subunit M